MGEENANPSGPTVDEGTERNVSSDYVDFVEKEGKLHIKDKMNQKSHPDVKDKKKPQPKHKPKLPTNDPRQQSQTPFPAAATSRSQSLHVEGAAAMDIVSMNQHSNIYENSSGIKKGKDDTYPRVPAVNEGTESNIDSDYVDFVEKEGY